MFRNFLLLALVGFGIVCEKSEALADADGLRSTSEWFEVESFQNGPPACHVLGLCEDIRVELFRVWGGIYHNPTWNPRCKIRLHPTRTSYLKTVGSQGGQTS
ncbi:MAG TPA: hypothetical protein VM260_20465, partial [Pirellula sp.]|nr:hypothetical protein [Pirellula sp.]